MAEYVKGIYFKAPAENAPSFIKSKVSFKVSDVIESLQANANEKGYVNADMKQKDDGTYYLQLDTYQRGSSGPPR